MYYLVVKNSGNSGGTLRKIDMKPNIDWKDCKGWEENTEVLTNAKNIFLAPNQKISSYFPLKLIKNKIFEVTITYETLSKEYAESYIIDLSYRDSIESLKHYLIDTNNEIEVLHFINDSLQEISEKLL